MKNPWQASHDPLTKTASLPSSASSSVGRKSGAAMSGSNTRGSWPTPTRTRCPGSAATDRFRIWRSLPRLAVAKKASRWCASKLARSGSRAQPENPVSLKETSAGPINLQRGPVLEVENDSARNLEAVLRLAKEAGAHVIAFQAERNAWVPAVISSTTGLDDVRVALLSDNLGLFAGAAKNCVQPGFPMFLPPGDLWTGAIGCNLHVFVGENRGGKDAGNVSFNPEPVVCEVHDRSVDADGAGIEDRGSEAQPARGDTQLPAVVVAATVEKPRRR